MRKQIFFQEKFFLRQEMKLWVGIVFLVVYAQLGINARPIPRLRPLMSDGR